MRILKFLGVFLITAILLFGFVFGFNWKSFNIFFDNREAMIEGNEWVHKTHSLKGLSEFMGEKPKYASVASRVITAQDSSINFQENKPRVMGTTSNFFILLAYSIKIDNGTFHEDDVIAWEQVEQYQLPDVDESVLQETYREAERRGWIEDEAITLRNALSLLAQYNTMALADYLWWQLDPAVWETITSDYNLSNTEMPLPFSGLYISISPGIMDVSTQEIIERSLELEQAEWRDYVKSHSERFKNDSDFRNTVKQYMRSNRLGNTFMEERDAMILFPKATASELTKILELIVNRQFVNESVSERVKDIMRWPMRYQSGIDQNFVDYGAIYDNRMGLLNGIDFGTSVYTEDTTIQAFFLDRLPIGFWFHASGGHMHQDFMQRLIFDPAMIDQMNLVVQELKNNENQLF